MIASTTHALSVALKLQAALQGIRVAPGRDDGVDRLCAPQSRADGVRSIIAQLPGSVTLSASLDAESADAPLLSTDSLPRLQFGENNVGATIVQPAFYQRLTRKQRPMSQVVSALGSLLAVNMGAACSFSLRGAACRFCRAGTPLPAAESFPMSVGEVVETIRAAFDEGLRGPVYFNTSFLGGDDSGITFLEPYIRAVKRNLPTLVAVQLHPPKTNEWIDRAYAMGVDAISFGIDMHDANVLQRLCPGRVRFLRRERYYEALAYAATIFPRGTVWSELVVGIEPIESTRRGIGILVGDGVLPVLSPMRSSYLAQLRGVSAIPVDDVLTLMADLYTSVSAAKLPLGWVRDLCFAITPFEARALVGQDAVGASSLEKYYGSRWHDLAARNLSRLRRRLRVRQVDDGSQHMEG